MALIKGTTIQGERKKRTRRATTTPTHQIIKPPPGGTSLQRLLPPPPPTKEAKADRRELKRALRMTPKQRVATYGFDTAETIRRAELRVAIETQPQSPTRAEKRTVGTTGKQAARARQDALEAALEGTDLFETAATSRARLSTAGEIATGSLETAGEYLITGLDLARAVRGQEHSRVGLALDLILLPTLFAAGPIRGAVAGVKGLRAVRGEAEAAVEVARALSGSERRALEAARRTMVEGGRLTTRQRRLVERVSTDWEARLQTRRGRFVEAAQRSLREDRPVKEAVGRVIGKTAPAAVERAAAREADKLDRAVELAFRSPAKPREELRALDPVHGDAVEELRAAQRAYDKARQAAKASPEAKKSLDAATLRLGAAKNNELYARAEALSTAEPLDPSHPFYGTREALAARLIEDYAGRQGALPQGMQTPEDVQRVMAFVDELATKGEHGRMWYENSAAAIVHLARGDKGRAEKIAQLFAIFSPQQPILGNTSLAFRAYNDWLLGRKIEVGQKWQRDAAKRVLDGTGDWEGRKTNNFYRNFVEDIYEGDPEELARLGVQGNEVTTDLWMARAFGYLTDNVSEGRYDVVQSISREIAAERGWKPKQVQAAIWTAIKDISDDVSANIDFATGVDRHLAQLNYEVIRGTDPAIDAAFDQWPIRIQAAYIRAKMSLVDRFTDEVGLLSRTSEGSSGLWDDVESPGAQLKIGTSAAPRKQGGGVSYKLAPRERKLLDVTAAAIGRALNQDAVAWARPFKPLAKGHVDLIEVRLGRRATAEEATALHRALNPRRERFAVIHSDEGLLVKNLSGSRVKNLSQRKGEEDFHSLVTGARDTVFADQPRLVGYASDGNLVRSDSYEQALRRAFGNRRGSGQADRFAEAADRLARESRQVDGDFLDNAGAAAADFAIAGEPRGLSLGDVFGTPTGHLSSALTRSFADEAGRDAEDLPPLVPDEEIRRLTEEGRAKVRKAARGSKEYRDQQAILRAEEIAARAKAADEAMRGLEGEEALLAARQKLRGKLPQVEFGGLRDLDHATWELMVNHIVGHPDLLTFERQRAFIALTKMVRGQLPQANEVRLLNQVFGKGTVDSLKAERAKLHTLQRAFIQLYHFPRTMMSTFDLSAPLRQGLVTAVRHPRVFTRNFMQMHKMWAHEGAYENVMRDIVERPSWPLMRRHRLALTDLGEEWTQREELFMSDWAEVAFGLGKKTRGPVRMSSRAYTGFLNKTRADLFDAALAKSQRWLETQGYTLDTYPETDKMLDDLARVINSATGRGEFGKSQFAKDLHDFANYFLFSPRLLASRINFLNPYWYARLHPQARKEAISSFAAMVGMVSFIAGLAKMGGASVEVDPRSSDFAKIKVGDTRIDLLGGFQQPVRYGAQIITGTVISPVTGLESKLTAGGFGDPNRMSTFFRFLRSKLAPMPSLVVDWATGKDFIGQPFDAKKAAYERMIPILATDLIEMKQQGQGYEDLLQFTPAIYGVGMQHYQARPGRAEGEITGDTGDLAELDQWLKDQVGDTEEFDEWLKNQGG